MGYERNFLPRKKSKMREIIFGEGVVGILHEDLEQFQKTSLEKEMASHSSVLPWRIPGTGEPGGLRLWGHIELDTTEVT